MNSSIVIRISGASGSIYGVRILKALKNTNHETHLVISSARNITIAHEIKEKLKDIISLADFYYSEEKIASGSFKTSDMVIAPCSMKTMSEIASGVTSNLLTRAADVTLKERRKLVLLVRESPLHLGQLRNMLKLTEIGAIIAPPMPAFYIEPKYLDDIVNHAVGKVLNFFDIALPDFKECQKISIIINSKKSK